MDTVHIDLKGSPLCGASAAGALIVEIAVHATCPLCLQGFAAKTQSADAASCAELHKLIQGGQAEGNYLGVQQGLPGGDLELFDCPRCKSTISRRA